MKEKTGMKQSRMKIIGLAGGVGTGKSTIAAIIREKFGGYVIMADEVGHKAMEVGTISYHQILDSFGYEILREDKTINRSKLADIVFQNADKLEQLNQIIHPFVMEYIKNKIEEVKREESYSLFFIESAILIETGYQNICDEIWIVETEEEIRRERLKASRGYSDEKIDSIMKKQMQTDELRSFADVVIENNRGLREIERQLENLLV